MAGEHASPGQGRSTDARLGVHLRRVRMQQGLSLHDVEDLSDGEIKASVLGAYERGERSVSLGRLRELAGFYRVPVVELLPESVPVGEVDTRPVVIDLQVLEQRRDALPALTRYVEGIRRLRGDYNGRVLTVREEDLRTLAAARGSDPSQLRAELSAVGLLR